MTGPVTRSTPAALASRVTCLPLRPHLLPSGRRTPKSTGPTPTIPQVFTIGFNQNLPLQVPPPEPSPGFISCLALIGEQMRLFLTCVTHRLAASPFKSAPSEGGGFCLFRSHRPCLIIICRRKASKHLVNYYCCSCYWVSLTLSPPAWPKSALSRRTIKVRIPNA